MALTVIKGDITKMKVDAIVNAANTSLRKAPGVCSAIFHAADTKALEQACNKIGHCPPGKAVLTNSFGLPAKYIIHTVGPSWYGGRRNEKMLLEECYEKSLNLAYACECRSVAFPLIFSGGCTIPRKDALLIARNAIEQFLKYHPSMDVYLVLYNDAIYEMAHQLYQKKAEKKLSFSALKKKWKEMHRKEGK